MLLLICILEFTNAEVDVVCRYGTLNGFYFINANGPSYYGCLLSEFTYTDQRVGFNIKGDHDENKTDSDVEAVHFGGLFHIKAIPTQIFEKFPNMKRFMVGFTASDYDSLESFHQSSFTGASNLKELVFFIGVVPRLEHNTFLECHSLESLHITFYTINFISAGAFNGLTELKTLDLTFNLIEHLDPLIFNPLVNLETLTLTGNKIKTIGAQTFAMLVNLVSIYLDMNTINAIQINTFYLPKLNLISLHENQCINVNFVISLGFFLPDLDESLSECYKNYDHPYVSTIIPETTTNDAAGFFIEAYALLSIITIVVLILHDMLA